MITNPVYTYCMLIMGTWVLEYIFYHFKDISLDNIFRNKNRFSGARKGFRSIIISQV